MSPSPSPATSLLSTAPATALGEQRLWYWRGWRIRYTHLTTGCITASTAPHQAPLLLLHGAGSSLEQWRENLTALAQERPVYALDLLGFGGSQKPAIALNTDLWVAQVAAFWQAYLRRPMILMGHSLGASVALQAATTHPDQVARLVMLTLPAARQEIGNAAAKIGAVVEGWFTSPLLMRSLFTLIKRPKLIRSVLTKLYQQPERVDDALLAGFVRPTQDRGAARTFCYLVKSRTSDNFSPTTRDLIPLLHIPTLLLWGKRDRVIPIAWGQYVNTLSDQLTFVEVEDAGHFFYDERADDLHSLIDQWLAGQLPTGEH
ncbi:MAG: putative hydrolases or acyltransferases (alpha/beta hydrolase superfamily) [Phormidesmis priestleyi Ana]|uniref:Putative hydrolases or acyltransferases (Alpha/beta hydrolase superfamily) n=1 Tax=Phormidesmis priestleyi Ana TaxID=1666911 RepID=A0A0P8C4U5_9CYAN|nr:MAG: putative hydrolases or acyltransferases (alpha/beta hydrolase superfamily) [Phormidesmis priestleyi Ana]